MSVYKFDNGKVEPLKKMTGAEIIEEENADAADTLERLENNPAEDPFAATDAAETAKAETETKRGDSETEKAETETEKPETGTKKREWVEEAYKCFIKDAGDIDPTDPVKAIEAYFQKNATDELKARCKAEGKDAKGCWRFIEAVARKALHGSSGHIDPGVVYAIAMHWFEDVPKDWDGKAAEARPSGQGKVAKPKKPTTRKERLEERVAHGSTKAKAELRELKKKERAKAKPKAKKPKNRQGFFFEMLKMQPDEQKPCGSSSPQASAGASGEETAMEPSSLPASTSSEESEVQG